MKANDHLIRTKAYPVALAQISSEDSKCAVLGVAIADDQTCEDKFVFWS